MITWCIWLRSALKGLPCRMIREVNTRVVSKKGIKIILSNTQTLLAGLITALSKEVVSKAKNLIANTAKIKPTIIEPVSPIKTRFLLDRLYRKKANKKPIHNIDNRK